MLKMNKLALNIPSAMALYATSQSLQIEYNPLPLLSIGHSMADNAILYAYKRSSQDARQMQMMHVKCKCCSERETQY